MADVDMFLNEEWPALGDSEALEKQLEQCTVRGFYIYIYKTRKLKSGFLSAGLTRLYTEYSLKKSL